MSGSYGAAGGQYSALLQALAARRQQGQQQQPQYPAAQGGTMQSQVSMPPQVTPAAGGMGAIGAAMPSPMSMADMLRRMSEAPPGPKNEGMMMNGDPAQPAPGLWDRLSTFGSSYGG